MKQSHPRPRGSSGAGSNRTFGPLSALAALIVLALALVMQWVDHDATDSLMRWLAIAMFVSMAVGAAPLLKGALRRHSVESSLFFVETFVILGAIAWGTAWLTDRVGWTEDMVYLAVPAVFVALPLMWLPTLLIIRMRRLRGGFTGWVTRLARRTLVLVAIGVVVWGYWQASVALGIQSQAYGAAWILVMSIAAWHMGAIYGSNRNQMRWGSKAYTTEGLIADFTGEGIATLRDVRRVFATWVRAHRVIAVVFMLALAGGCLWQPDYVGIAGAIALFILGWVFGERAQDVVDAAERDEHAEPNIEADAA